MKRKNSATAALTASRWKKISKRKRRKKSPAPRLPKAGRPHPSAFLRLLPLSPGPRHPPPAVEAEAASPVRKRRRPRSLPRKKPRRSLRKRKRQNVRRKKRRKKARSAAKSASGLERLRLSKAARANARLFIFRLPPQLLCLADRSYPAIRPTHRHTRGQPRGVAWNPCLPATQLQPPCHKRFYWGPELRLLLERKGRHSKQQTRNSHPRLCACSPAICRFASRAIGPARVQKAVPRFGSGGCLFARK